MNGEISQEDRLVSYNQSIHSWSLIDICHLPCSPNLNPLDYAAYGMEVQEYVSVNSLPLSISRSMQSSRSNGAMSQKFISPLSIDRMPKGLCFADVNIINNIKYTSYYLLLSFIGSLGDQLYQNVLDRSSLNFHIYIYGWE